MSQESRKPGLVGKSPFSVGPLITDPDELQRLDALRPPDDGGVERVVGAALEIARDREERGKPTDLLKGILGLAELLTPEQRLELLRQLQQPHAA